MKQVLTSHVSHRFAYICYVFFPFQLVKHFTISFYRISRHVTGQCRTQQYGVTGCAHPGGSGVGLVMNHMLNESFQKDPGAFVQEL